MSASVDVAGPSVALAADAARVSRHLLNTSYAGAELDGLPHGLGRATRDGQLVFDGSWLAGKRVGQGSLYAACGMLLYEGGWADDRMHGQGVLYFVGAEAARQSAAGATGLERYRGEFARGVRHGRGTLLRHGATQYEGEWQQDKWHGAGEQLYSDGGRMYRGAFARGLRDGAGTFTLRATLADGRALHAVYEGGWRDDLPHGVGACGFVAGHTAPLHEWGVWQQPASFSAAAVPQTSGVAWHYIGQWRAGAREGEGRVYRAESLVYEGQLRANELHGEGLQSGLEEAASSAWSVVRGDAHFRRLRYQGSFVAGRRSGHGLLYVYSKNATLSAEPPQVAADSIESSTASLFSVVASEFEPRADPEPCIDAASDCGSDAASDAASSCGSDAASDCGSDADRNERVELYRGGWKDGAPCGAGSASLDGAVFYVGQWRDGQMHGTGVSTQRPSGVTFDGTFRRSSCAVGTFRSPSQRLIGRVFDGSYTGTGRLAMRADEVVDMGFEPRGDCVYLGDFAGGVRSGRGTLTDSTGYVLFEGPWRHGLPGYDGPSHDAPRWFDFDPDDAPTVQTEGGLELRAGARSVFQTPDLTSSEKRGIDQAARVAADRACLSRSPAGLSHVALGDDMRDQQQQADRRRADSNRITRTRRKRGTRGARKGRSGGVRK